jgi:hypothetical protein
MPLTQDKMVRPIKWFVSNFVIGRTLPRPAPGGIGGIKGHNVLYNAGKPIWITPMNLHGDSKNHKHSGG